MNRSFVVLVRSCSTQSTRAAPVAAAAAAAVSGNVPKTFVSRKERRLADVVERRFEDGHVWRGVVSAW
jgi:hypothetical protein